MLDPDKRSAGAIYRPRDVIDGNLGKGALDTKVLIDIHSRPTDVDSSGEQRGRRNLYQR